MSLFASCNFEEINTNPFEMSEGEGAMDGFLLGLDALAVVVIAHGHHDEIAAAALADACHKNDLSFI